MATLWAKVILGGKNPLVVLLTSNCADDAGVLVPIPTCAWTLELKIAITTNRIPFFILKALRSKLVVEEGSDWETSLNFVLKAEIQTKFY